MEDALPMKIGIHDELLPFIEAGSNICEVAGLAHEQKFVFLSKATLQTNGIQQCFLLHARKTYVARKKTIHDYDEYRRRFTRSSTVTMLWKAQDVRPADQAKAVHHDALGHISQLEARVHALSSIPRN